MKKALELSFYIVGVWINGAALSRNFNKLVVDISLVDVITTAISLFFTWGLLAFAIDSAAQLFRDCLGKQEILGGTAPGYDAMPDSRPRS